MNSVQVEISEIGIQSIAEATLNNEPNIVLACPPDGFMRLHTVVEQIIRIMRKSQEKSFKGVCFNNDLCSMLIIELDEGDDYWVRWFHDGIEPSIWCDGTDLEYETHFSWDVTIHPTSIEITQQEHESE